MKSRPDRPEALASAAACAARPGCTMKSPVAASVKLLAAATGKPGLPAGRRGAEPETVSIHNVSHRSFSPRIAEKVFVMQGGVVGEQTVPGLLAIRVGEDAEAIAFTVDGERPLTFGQWLTRARACAGGLIDRGVSAGDRIGLVFDGAEWNEYAIAFCAAHLAGAVGVPLSARQPADRVNDVLARCGAVLTIRGSAEVEALEAGRHGPTRNPQPRDIAQILHTSGTTGLPKGVAATHANLTTGFAADPIRRPLGHSRQAVHAFPIGTNAAQTMLLNALTARPTVVTLARFDSERLCEIVERHRIGSVFLVPAMAADLVNSGAQHRHDLSCIRLIGSTAAALPAAVAIRLADAFPGAAIVNYYTSTEAAPAQTTMVFDRTRPTAVGRPARSDDLMIRGTRGEPLAAGETGTVWLRTPSPRWYVDESEASTTDGGWVRMGDLGYLDGDGYLHLVDRESDIIVTGAHKVSCLRVENALYAHPDVLDAAVVGVEHPSMGAMVGAVIVTGRAVDPAELRALLGRSLAPHEIPIRVSVVDSLPRNEGGKVVKRDLAGLLWPRVPDAPLRTPAEQRVARIWQAALGTPSVTASSDFFGLGGDSMRAAQVAVLASEQWNASVSAEDVLARPTVAAFAEWVAAKQPAGAAVEHHVSADGSRLTALQRMWLAEPANGDALRVVPIHVTIAVAEPLDPDLVRRCLETLTVRHNELRTQIAAAPKLLRPDEAVVCQHQTASDLDTATAAAAEFVVASAKPPVRALVTTVAPDLSLLTVSIDHLVCDGWSMGIVLKEFGLLYSALRQGGGDPLRPPAVTAAEVATWVRSQWAASQPYWQQLLSEPIADPVPLPGQRIRPGVYDGASHEFTVGSDVVAALRETARTSGTTLARVTLAAWAATLRCYTGSAEIAFLTPLTGRTRPEWEAVVGCLMQQPVIRIRLDDDPPPPGLLARVHQQAALAAEHQFYPVHEYAHRVAHPAYFFFEPWTRPAHIPGLRSNHVALPPELGLRWPLAGADLSPPRLRLTDRAGVLQAQMVYNRSAVSRTLVEDLARGFVRACSDMAYAHNGSR